MKPTTPTTCWDCGLRSGVHILTDADGNELAMCTLCLAIFAADVERVGGSLRIDVAPVPVLTGGA